MSNKLLPLHLAVLSTFAIASAQTYGPNIYVPESTRLSPFPWTYGVPHAHTNHLIYVGPWDHADVIRPEAPSHGPAALVPTINGYSPTQIRAAYNMPSSGGAGAAIAIIDAFHYQTSLNDFNVFATQFGLPQETSANPTASGNQVFQVIYQGSSQPAANASWGQEAALDIEWAHALAPDAKIYLIEANSAAITDLLACVNKAATLPNVQAVSMSWGVTEFSTQASDDFSFQHAGIAYFAASGDTGGAETWPATSPFVVNVGGTKLSMGGTLFLSEIAWTDGGGGPSSFYGRPAFQHRVYTLVGGRRGGPDIATDADPATGCAVYDSTPSGGLSGWLVFGGTSLSTPTVAGMYVTSGAPALNSYNELVRLYLGYGGPSFRDIRQGSNTRFPAVAGWDFATGIGAPVSTNAF